jgi:hypothetical protein
MFSQQISPDPIWPKIQPNSTGSIQRDTDLVDTQRSESTQACHAEPIGSGKVQGKHVRRVDFVAGVGLKIRSG